MCWQSRRFPSSAYGEEFEKFAYFPYSRTILKGTAAKQKKRHTKLSYGGMQVAVVNYKSAWQLKKLPAYNTDMVIADEAHKLKENRSSQSMGMHHIGDKARYKLLLTGTVITNRELDVFTQYRFLNPQIFCTSFYAFRNRHFDMGGYGNHTPIFRKRMTDDFLKRLHSVAYRVTKMKRLDRSAITEEVRTVVLEKDAIKQYDSIKDESYAKLDASEVTTANSLTRFLHLSQITGEQLADDDGVVNTANRSKLDALSDIIDSVMVEEKKIVVMARFVSEPSDIQQLLKKEKIS